MAYASTEVLFCSNSGLGTLDSSREASLHCLSSCRRQNHQDQAGSRAMALELGGWKKEPFGGSLPNSELFRDRTFQASCSSTPSRPNLLRTSKSILERIRPKEASAFRKGFMATFTRSNGPAFAVCSPAPACKKHSILSCHRHIVRFKIVHVAEASTRTPHPTLPGTHSRQPAKQTTSYASCYARDNEVEPGSIVPVSRGSHAVASVPVARGRAS